MREAGNELAARLRAARSYAKGTTLKDIARVTGLSPSTVGTWSSDEYVPINRLGHFDKIAELCGLPLEFFTADLRELGQLPTDARFATPDAEAPADDRRPMPPRRRLPSEREDDQRGSASH